jgi:hypothetical protein
MLDRAIGLLGIALAVITLVAPYRWPKLPSWATLSGLTVGGFLIGLAIGLIVADRRNDAEASEILTDLKLEFFGDQRPPRELHQDNIATWYAIWSPTAIISERDKEGKEVGRQVILPKTWNIFLTFTKPAAYRQILLSLYDGDLPQYEIKQSNPKFAIIQILGDVPKGLLEINAQS